MSQWTIEQRDSGTIRPWDKRQRDNGPMSNEMLVVGTMDTETMRSGTMDSEIVDRCLCACVADIYVDSPISEHGPTCA